MNSRPSIVQVVSGLSFTSTYPIPLLHKASGQVRHHAYGIHFSTGMCCIREVLPFNPGQDTVCPVYRSSPCRVLIQTNAIVV